jgi:hypothetical protein
MICDILVMLRKREYPFHSVDGVVLVQDCLHQPQLQQKLKVVGSESRSARLTEDRMYEGTVRLRRENRLRVRTRDEARIMLDRVVRVAAFTLLA